MSELLARRRERRRPRPTDRARPRPRAAASGADPDGYPAPFAASPLQPAYRAAGAAAAPHRRPSRCGWSRFEGGLVRDRPRRRRGFAFDNEARATSVLAGAVRARRPAGDQRRVAGLHGRRRLPPPGALAVRRLGARSARRAGPRRSTGEERRRRGWRADDPARPAPARSAPPRSATSATTRPTPTRAGPARACRPRPSGSTPRSGLPVARQLRWAPARCARCRRPPPARDGPAADVRRRLGMDPERLRALSGLPRRPPARSASTTASSWSASSCCAAAPASTPRRPLARQLPQLLLSRISAGCSPASAWHATHDAARTDSGAVSPQTSSPRRVCRGRADRPVQRRRSGCRRQYFYDAEGCELFEEITRLAGVLSDPHRDRRPARSIAREHGRACRRACRAGGVRLRLQPQDRAAARRALPQLARLRAHRHLAVRARRGLARGWQQRFPGLEIVARRWPTSPRALQPAGGASSRTPAPASSRAPPSATSRRRRPGACCAHFAPRARARRAPDRRRRPRQGPAAPGRRLRRRRGRHGGVQHEPAGAHQPRARRRLRPGALPAPRRLRPATQAASRCTW